MDLTDISAAYAPVGPFATIYLDTAGDLENAADKLELRWKNVLRELTDLGVDEATRDALTAARGGVGSGSTRVLVAAAGEVQLAESLPEPPATEIVSLAPLPQLLPYVESVSLRVPHVIVLTDRQGADVLAYGTGAEPAVAGSVQSDRHPIHKTGKGGWSELRYQHNVENTWDASARDVAEAVTNVAGSVGARLIVAAGDPKALPLLRQHLPQELQGRFVTVDGSRAAGQSEPTLAGHVLEALEERLARDTLELLDAYARERGQHDRAADGVAATVEALRSAAVDTLLLTDTLDPAATAFFGPEPTLLALSATELTDLGVDAPVEAPLVDVLLRAAAGTAASVTLVPADVPEAPEGGVGALLRYSTA